MLIVLTIPITHDHQLIMMIKVQRIQGYLNPNKTTLAEQFISRTSQKTTFSKPQPTTTTPSEQLPLPAKARQTPPILPESHLPFNLFDIQSQDNSTRGNSCDNHPKFPLSLIIPP